MDSDIIERTFLAIDSKNIEEIKHLSKKGIVKYCSIFNYIDFIDRIIEQDFVEALKIFSDIANNNNSKLKKDHLNLIDDVDHSSPLFQAARKGRYQCFEELAKNKTTKNIVTALVLATYHKQKPEVISVDKAKVIIKISEILKDCPKEELDLHLSKNIHAINAILDMDRSDLIKPFIEIWDKEVVWEIFWFYLTPQFQNAGYFDLWNRDNNYDNFFRIASFKLNNLISQPELLNRLDNLFFNSNIEDIPNHILFKINELAKNKDAIVYMPKIKTSILAMDIDSALKEISKTKQITNRNQKINLKL